MSLPLPHTAEGLVREARASNQGKSSSSKGKNAPKDFTKVKNKVGKKKKEKSNEMKTDYKVKKVQMPAQHALEEKGEEVTHRKFLGIGRKATA